MTVLIIIIILIFTWPYIWRWMRPYVYRWMQRRTEDYMRRAMGMPPHDRDSTRRQQTYRSGRQNSSNDTEYRNRHESAGPVIPKEYAEDVEFIEIRSFSEEEKIGGESSVRYVHESQVSDAEIIEIKKDR